MRQKTGCRLLKFLRYSKGSFTSTKKVHIVSQEEYESIYSYEITTERESEKYFFSYVQRDMAYNFERYKNADLFYQQP